MAAPNQKQQGGPVIERELVVRFVAGERAAFTEVFELLRVDIFMMVRRFFSSPFEQEEAFQEVWIQLHRGRGRFDVNRHDELVPWARQVARNRCRDLLRKRGRVREIPVEASEGSQGQEPPGQLNAVARSRLRQALNLFADKLGAEERRFFQVCLVEERGHAEVAAALSITERRSKYLKKKMVGRMMKDGALRRELVEANQ